MSSGPPAYKSGEFGEARAIRLRFYGADAENLRHGAPARSPQLVLELVLRY